IRTSEGVCQLIYSQSPLSTWVTARYKAVVGSQAGLIPLKLCSQSHLPTSNLSRRRESNP
ncbi:MAG: hypothetical protein U1B80_07120, partial [Anaerolineaceae bacterium]|nr:hypothetical protein [Anaerolineaceae bacterium]